MHAGHPGAARRSVTFSALGVAAVCLAGARAYAQPLYEQQPATGDQQQGPAYQPSPDQQQAPGYPPPAAQYASPAPYQPPADYQPPPASGGTTQQPTEFSAPPPVPPDRQRGFLIMPYVGGNSFQGSSGQSLGIGVRFGGMAGLRFGDINGGHGNGYMFSANTECGMDLGNRKNPLAGSQFDVHGIFAASPLLHLIMSSLPNTELVVGPKLGYWLATAKATDTTASYYSGTTTSTYTKTYVGFVAGLNLGAFYGMGDTVALGALLNFDFRLPSTCSLGASSSSSSSSSTCPAGSYMQVFSLTVAALF